MKGSGVMRIRRTNWRSSKQRDSYFFIQENKRDIIHDAFHYFLSIYVRFGQFTFRPVKFSYVLAQMACKFSIPKSLTKPGLIRGVAFDGSFPYKRGTTVYIFKTEMKSVIIRLLYAMTWFPSALVFVNLRQVLIIWSHLELRGHTVLRSHILNHSGQISLCTF